MKKLGLFITAVIAVVCAVSVFAVSQNSCEWQAPLKSNYAMCSDGTITSVLEVKQPSGHAVGVQALQGGEDNTVSNLQPAFSVKLQ